MPFILDASVALVWAFGDEQQLPASSAFKRLRTDEALVPSLWWFEVRNALVINERRGRLTESDTAVFLNDVSQLRIAIDHTPDEQAILRLTRRHRLSVYDAAYLELAQRAAVPLATLDNDLARAARAEKVPLI